MIRGLEHLACEERLRVGVVRLGEEKAPGRPHCGLSACKDLERLFTRACKDRTRHNSIKVKVGIFSLYIRKKFLMLKVMRHWERLPREVVDAQSLEAFKVRLNGALSNLS